jgi:translation initiation factor 1
MLKIKKLKKLSGGFDDLLNEAESAIEQEETKIKIFLEQRSYGKEVTVISGINDKNIKELVKYLKTELGTGGTYKNGVIELRGDVRKRVKNLLVKWGYKEDQIEVE